MASVRGLLNIQSLNESTHEKFQTIVSSIDSGNAKLMFHTKSTFASNSYPIE